MSKTPEVRNLFASDAPAAGAAAPGVPDEGNTEVTSLLARGEGFRLERIVSHGEASPPGFWYDQPDDEWVLLLRGTAVLAFKDARVELGAGDHLLVPARVKHRVERVSEDAVWVAAHFAAAPSS